MTGERTSFRLDRLYHLTHLVDDLDAVDRWHDDLFVALHVKRNTDAVAQREASFVVIGDIILEAVCVIDGPRAQHSPLGKFRERFGERMHSVAMFVDDVGLAARDLTRRQYRLFNLVGEQLVGTATSPWIWTHPKETRTLFEFAEVPQFHWDPRFHPSWTGDFWRRHPLGIERTSHLTVLVDDLDAVRPVYCDAFGCRSLHREEIPGTRRSEFYEFGPDLVLEALQPLQADSLEGQQLARYGAGAFGFTFAVRNLADAVAHLESKGQAIARADTDTVVLDPAGAFGLGIGFTTRKIPNDPRPELSN
jgi:catechol 2,3-dioxygenase-like lactoylglutathione lyase family enzyme